MKIFHAMLGVAVQPKRRSILAVCAALALGMAAISIIESESQAAPNQRSARIYFIRQKAFYASWANPSIKIDGQAVGSLASGSYVLIERAAGRHTLRVEPPVALGYFEADVHVEAGKTYYFEVGPYHTATGGVLLPALAGNVGKPVSGRSFNSGWQFNTLDAATGVAEIGKLKTNSR